MSDPLPADGFWDVRFNEGGERTATHVKITIRLLMDIREQMYRQTKALEKIAAVMEPLQKKET